MKLNKLLPIVTLTGIATIAAPLIASCSCGGGGNTPTEDVIVTGKFSWQSGESAETDPFVYPDNCQPLAEGEMKIGQAWDKFVSDDNCAYYLACDYINFWATMISGYIPNATFTANAELNITKQRFSLNLTIKNTELDMWIKLTNVPVSITNMEDPDMGLLWAFAPVGALMGAIDIFSMLDWKIEADLAEDQPILSPESSLQDIDNHWLNGYSIRYIALIHYFDNIDPK